MRRLVGRMRRKAAYTLVEVLYVTAVVGILSTSSFPSYSGATTPAKFTEGIAACGTIRTAMTIYAIKHDGKFPEIGGANGNDLRVLGISPKLLDGKFFDPEDYLVVSDARSYYISVTYEDKVFAIDEKGREIGSFTTENRKK